MLLTTKLHGIIGYGNSQYKTIGKTAWLLNGKDKCYK